MIKCEYQDTLESKMILPKDEMTLEKVGVTFWKDKKLHQNINRTTNAECSSGDYSGEREYIPRQTDFKGRDPELNPASTSDRGRRFNSLWGLLIHLARGSKQRISLIGECKSNDEVMNLDFIHSVQDPIVEQQRPGEILSKLRIQRTKGNQKAI